MLRFQTSGEPLSYLITKGIANLENYTESSNSILKLTANAAAAGVNFIQLREKGLPARLLVELARETISLCKDKRTRVLINERFDLAIAAGAGGVHLTSTSIPVASVKDHCPPDFVVGVSTHSLIEANLAKKGGADYVFFGPVYQTPAKMKHGSPQGVEELRHVCRELDRFPVIAVGGIDADRIGQVLEAGAAGYAAIRFFGELDWTSGQTNDG